MATVNPIDITYLYLLYTIMQVIFRCKDGNAISSLSSLALDCISADQSDFTGAICLNYIHSFEVMLKYCVGVLNWILEKCNQVQGLVDPLPMAQKERV